MLNIKETLRRIDRASLGFEQDEEWVGTNLSEIVDCIYGLQAKLNARNNEGECRYGD